MMHIVTIILVLVTTGSLYTPVYSQVGGWQPTNGPSGGSITSLLHQADGPVYASTIGSGIYRSTDDAGSWVRIENGILPDTVLSLAVSAGGSHIAATHRGIFRSTDSGSTWGFAALPDTIVYALMADSKGGVYAGVRSDGVHYSSDDGQHWNRVTPESLSTDTWCLAMNDSGNIFSGTDDGIIRSTDGGTTWMLVNEGLDYTDVVALSSNSEGDIFAGTLRGGLYRSTDNGKSWEAVNTGLLNPGDMADISALLVDPNDRVYAAVHRWSITQAWNEIFRTTDRGANWEQAAGGLPDTYLRCLAMGADDRIYTGTYGAGIFASDDGGITWQSRSDGVTNTMVWSLAADSHGDIFAGVDRGGVQSSSDRGLHWVPTGGYASGSVREMVLSDSDHILALFSPIDPLGSITGAYKSTDRGVTWLDLELPGPYAPTSILFHSADVLVVGTSRNLIFRSTDGGSSWNSQMLTDSLMEIRGINSLIETPNGDIFAGCEKRVTGFPWVIRTGAVFRSTDYGVSWYPGTDPGLPVRKLAVDGNWILYAGLASVTIDTILISGRLVRSTDAGMTWLETPVASGDIMAIATRGNGLVVAGGIDGRVHRSTDSGVNWDDMGSGLPGVPVLSLLIDADGYAYAGTAGHGVYRGIHPVTHVSGDGPEHVQSFSLHQNYPNPFNPGTTIRYGLPEAAFVTIKVFNLLGQRVVTLVDGRREAGSYEVEFSGSGLPGGVYFYRLEADRFIQTKSLLLIK